MVTEEPNASGLNQTDVLVVVPTCRDRNRHQVAIRLEMAQAPRPAYEAMRSEVLTRARESWHPRCP